MKKILLGLGVIGTIATPLSVAAGCGNDANQTPNPQTPNPQTPNPQTPQITTPIEAGHTVGMKGLTEKKVSPKDLEEFKYSNNSIGHISGIKKSALKNAEEGTSRIDEIIENAIPFEEKYLPTIHLREYNHEVTIISRNLIGYKLYEDVSGNKPGNMQWFVKNGAKDLPSKHLKEIQLDNENIRYFMVDFKIDEVKDKDYFEVFKVNKNITDEEAAEFAIGVLDFKRHSDTWMNNKELLDLAKELWDKKIAEHNLNEKFRTEWVDSDAYWYIYDETPLDKETKDYIYFKVTREIQKAVWGKIGQWAVEAIMEAPLMPSFDRIRMM